MAGLFTHIRNLLSCDIGIDLGTANTLIFMKGRGVVIREPSVVAMQKGTKKILAVGEEAKRMIGRTPAGIVAARPMKSGVIADFDITEAMIRYFISKARGHKVLRPRVVIAVPSEITEVEWRAVEEAAKHAGARDVTLIEEPMAAAIGVGLPVAEPSGNLIVDIGGGTCEVALISLAGIVQAKSVRVGGDTMDECIIQYMRRVYNLLIGERMAENIKVSIGSAYPLAEEMTMEVRGRDLVAGLPKTLLVTSEEIREALKDPVTSIVDAVRNLLAEAKPELSSDLVDRGIVLSGGSSLLRGLDRLIAAQTGLPVIVADDPLSGVANGTGRMLEELDFYKEHLARRH
ncbi:MAG: rod shape-determining protein [Candidatus Spyradenecus sp.]